MRIVVLDGHTLNPGDLDWGDLEKLGECRIYHRTPPEKVLQRSQNAEILLTNKVVLTRESIEHLPQLKYIGVLATGYNVVDIDAARDSNIPVTNVPAYSTNSVAQMVFAHLLNLTQHVAQHAATVSAGKWSAAKDFCYWDYPLVELADLTFGIVGLGRIGTAVAGIAHNFGMKVIATTVNHPRVMPDDITLVELESLLRNSDVVSLHCPLTNETQGMMNARTLGLMKKSAFLINTGRGPLIVEQDLADALNEGKIAGAGLDVLCTEPPDINNPLLKARNCFITPHIAWATKSARARLLNVVIENVRAFLNGNPQNVIN
ncbi:MAG: D-2-hydroxyacid dehydrogenase [Calditrichaeota bacterium]|nr:D-2-hydroxyacid dehydrogenase [Calditrichota bacterium]